ncbi:MAG TPA: Rrf2 family transcriptional regulator [Desulfuromonadales bacterium]|nr:Rrf2 family transcriptional regulator [Desulfuromonadales bacterium]
MISKKTIYAFKALIHLAGISDGHPVLIADLARDESIPKKFLEFILLSLRKGGVLNSRVGKGGGYTLALQPNKITLGAVIRILEGDIAPVQCLSTTNYARCEECTDEASCGIRLTLADLYDTQAAVLDTLTLADMVERSEHAQLLASSTLDFSI